jgi:2-polyprenyl-3-methyl-5-hydroxy-6-metoxy-1,4-benzoquinol methylase/predicted RNA-binding Zn-ribbon protein involved in translation (DUF1610 family)
MVWSTTRKSIAASQASSDDFSLENQSSKNDPDLSKDIYTNKRVCPICQSGVISRQHPISRDPWKVVQCNECGFVYLQNPPLQEKLTDEYAWEKIDKIDRKIRHPKGKKRLSSRIARKILYYLIEPVVPRLTIPKLLSKFAPSGDILDVGCGRGNRLEGLESRFIPWGIEISKFLALEAKEQFVRKGGKVVQASAIEGLRSLPTDKFAAIVMRSYLEHEAFPRDILNESFRVAKPSGIIIIKVPNFGSINAKITGPDWCAVQLPAHVNYFRPHELNDIVTKAGYTVTQFNRLRYRLPTSDNMWLIGQKR